MRSWCAVSSVDFGGCRPGRRARGLPGVLRERAPETRAHPRVGILDREKRWAAARRWAGKVAGEGDAGGGDGVCGIWGYENGGKQGATHACAEEPARASRDA